MQLKAIMKKNLVSISPAASIVEAAWKMKNKNVGCLLVAEEGTLKGVLTDRDIVLSVVADGKDPLDMRVRDVMQTKIVSCTPETDVLEATRVMAVNRVRRLPILADGKVQGVVSITDLTRVVEEEIENLFSLRAAAA